MTRRAEVRRRLERWAARARAARGWSFDDLGARPLGPSAPWDYSELVVAYAQGARAALDLGTGGGEVLAALRAGLPARTVATEEWVVNAPVARRRLAPLGWAVVRASSLHLPFERAAFDLVLARHEEFAPAEVARVLCPGGVFVTQQVGPHDWPELRRRLPLRDWPDLRGAMRDGLREAGLAVERDEAHARPVRYPSLGEVVFLLERSRPWELPDFSVDRYLDALLQVEADCAAEGGLVLTEARHLLVARKPAAPA